MVYQPIQVVYTVDWTGDGGITKIKSHFELVSVPDDSPLPLVQTFETVFRQAKRDTVESVKFSGNPGYIVGEPIRAGKLSKNSTLVRSVSPTRYAVSQKSSHL